MKALFTALTAISLTGCAANAIHRQPSSAAPPVRIENVTRLCALTGEIDHQAGAPAHNRTEMRAKLGGTDLGASFQHKGRLVFLFGDTMGTQDSGRIQDLDSIAVSDGRHPDDCLDLQFPVDARGAYLPIDVRENGKSIPTAAFEVPTGGFSDGHAMYLFKTTDSAPPERVMGRTVLATATSLKEPWRALYTFSRDKFINVAPRVDGNLVYFFGSGKYRESSAYLAVSALGRIADETSRRFFAGTDAHGDPRWSSKESDSAPLFEQPCIGELSVGYAPGLRKWLMLYNCGAPPEILIRFADQPWGKWSEPVSLFEAKRDGGYCNFMYRGGPVAELPAGCVAARDPNSETMGETYGPYLIDSLTKSAGAGADTIYFVMSTWNPYNTVLMRATLRAAP